MEMLLKFGTFDHESGRNINIKGLFEWKRS